MKKFFGHLKTINTHKWWVFYYATKAGIPLRGLVHDMSKFSPTEFFESVKYWNGKSSPIDASKKENGWSKAWQHHKGRNKHHYEYWQDDFDHGGKPLCMPYKETVEMLCDFLAAGRAYNGKDFTYQGELDWWKNKKKLPLAMHPAQQHFITIALTIAAVINDVPTEKILKQIYEESVKRYNDR